jgi:NAD(P)-dependent dehydrogenase (short-subunit alcohol dehydrogenase family)
VINTSSAASKAFGKIVLDDLNHARSYRPLRAYGDAKLANVLHAAELHRRYHGSGLSAVAVHPGNVATNFASETNHLSRLLYRTPLSRLVLVTPERGAEPLLRLANGTPGVDWCSGDYYSKLRAASPNRQARNGELVRKLWDRSAEMVGLPELVSAV